MSDIAICIAHLSKQYRLGVINNGTLWRDIQTWIALKRGKEDPHSKIDENKYDTTEDSFWALKDVGFDIKQGDRVGIIGKNGAGKSTLLKIFSRITAPTEGSVKIKGKVASLLEVGTGFHSELTGRENIYLNGAILGMKKRRIDQLLDEIIAFSGIEQHIDTPVKRYSSGMSVRLAFAVAAHLDSDILIADEVLAVGDAEFQKKALGKMRDLSTGQGRTVIFVSHNMGAVERLCNKGIILQQGKLIQKGKIDEIIKAYSFSSSMEQNSLRPSMWVGAEGDEDFKFYKAEITITNATTAKIEITFEVFSPKEYFFSLSFYNAYTAQLCVSSASDNVTDEEYKLLCSKGLHSISLDFDTSIFSLGEYYIEFDFAIPNVKRLVSPNVKLYFNIDYTQKFHRHPSSARDNVIEPCWKWKIAT